MYYGLGGYVAEFRCWVSAEGKECSNEAALSLRSRRSGTKFAAPLPRGTAY